MRDHTGSQGTDWRESRRRAAISGIEELRDTLRRGSAGMGGYGSGFAPHMAYFGIPGTAPDVAETASRLRSWIQDLFPGDAARQAREFEYLRMPERNVVAWPPSASRPPALSREEAMALASGIEGLLASAGGADGQPVPLPVPTLAPRLDALMAEIRSIAAIGNVPRLIASALDHAMGLLCEHIGAPPQASPYGGYPGYDHHPPRIPGRRRNAEIEFLRNRGLLMQGDAEALDWVKDGVSRPDAVKARAAIAAFERVLRRAADAAATGQAPLGYRVPNDPHAYLTDYPDL